MTVGAEFDAQGRAPVSTREASKTGGATSSRRLRRQRDKREPRSRAVLVVALVFSAMGLGGLHWGALVPSALAALAACVLVLRSTGARSAYAPALAPLALSVFTLLQLVPLPLGVLRALSPHMAEVWQGALSPLGEQSSWGRLSADPGATLVEALKWAVYGWTLVAAIAAGRRRGAGFGAVVLFACAGLVAATTLLHGMANVSLVYGLYTPTFPPSRWNVGPFLNPNNLAGYLNLGIGAGAGLMFARRPAVPRVFLGLAVAVLVAMVVLGASRAGLAALVLSVSVFGVLAFRVRKGQGSTGSLSPARLVAGLVTAVGLAAVLAWLGSSDATWHALFDRNVEKVQVMRKVWPLVAEHALFGVGRGAFETVFPAYHFGPANVLYAHAENFVVQWVSEWGLPVGCATVVAFALFLWKTLRAARQSVTGVGIWCGVLALVAQNFLDLGMELPGVGVALATALGVLWGSGKRGESEDAPRGDRRGRMLVAWGVCAAGVALAGSVLAFGRSTALRDRYAIRDLVRTTRLKDTASLSATREALRAAMSKHPADPYFPRAGAVLAWHARQNPLPWIGRSLERGMHVGETHLSLARMLSGMGATEQTLLELRLACEYSPALCDRAGRLAFATTKDQEQIARAAPKEEGGAGFLYIAAMLFKPADYPDARLRLLSDVVARQPANAYYRSRLLEELAAALGPGAPPSSCGSLRERCESLAHEQITAMERLAPGAPDALMGRARLLAALGRPMDGEALLRQGCQRHSGQNLARCQRHRVSLAAQAGARELVDAASRDLASVGCASTKECASLYSFLGSQAERARDPLRAVGYYKRAAAEEPSDATLSALARSAAAVGDDATARGALSRLHKRSSSDGAVQQALDERRMRTLLAPPSPPR